MVIADLKRYFLADGLKVHWNFKLLPKGFEAITLFGHIYDVRSKSDLLRFLETDRGRVMVNHERIHMLQAKSFKCGYLTFYILYIWYWIKGLFKYGTKNNVAYYNIPFEREAYVCELDFNYNKSLWKDYIEDPQGA